MTYAPFWMGGLALASVVLAHFFLTGRHMAVSGRIGEIVDHLRMRRTADAPEPTQDELIAALRAMTLEEFGSDAVEEAPSAAPAPIESGPKQHLLFFGGLVLGGLVAALGAGTAVVSGLSGEGFAGAFGSGPSAVLALFAGGMLVGFGTRMAGGCTSGHGLVGVASRKVGSMAATASFFGAGIVMSFVLEALR